MSPVACPVLVAAFTSAPEGRRKGEE